MMMVDVLCCLRGAGERREDGVILNTELRECKDASWGIFGDGKKYNSFVSLDGSSCG